MSEDGGVERAKRRVEAEGQLTWAAGSVDVEVKGVVVCTSPYTTSVSGGVGFWIRGAGVMVGILLCAGGVMGGIVVQERWTGVRGGLMDSLFLKVGGTAVIGGLAVWGRWTSVVIEIGLGGGGAARPEVG